MITARTRFSCLEVAQAAGLKLGKKVGQEVLYTCPNHDDRHPSLKINPTKDCWLCGPCDKKGNGWELAAFIAGVNPDNKAAVTVRCSPKFGQVFKV